MGDTQRSRRLRAALGLVLPALGAAFVAAVAVTALLGLAAHGSVGCAACHGPLAAAATDSAHSTVSCASCHARPGIAGLLADGVRVGGWAAQSLTGAPRTGTFPDPEKCLRCHDAVRTDTIVSHGVAVRHSDFIGDTPCVRCHGGTGHEVRGRLSRAVRMEDCLGCHETAATDLDGCGLCHVRRSSNDERVAGVSAWRVTHGPGWRQTHGMGDQKTCGSCHPVDFCAKCHGVRIPHQADWPATHGAGLDAERRTKCATCHEPAWCSDCHGIEMPHPAGFLPKHGAVAKAAGAESCTRCHDPRSCDACHFESSHPNLPVDSSHGGSR